MTCDAEGRRRKPARLLVVCSSLPLVVLVVGCASGRYTAQTLPAHLRATVRPRVETLSLSKLAVSSTSSDVIDQGDVLEITISADLSPANTLTFPTRVNEYGQIHLPDLGNIPVAGLELEGAEASIAAVCIQRGLYRSPHVTVGMKRQRTNRVTVMGAVNKPGRIELPRGSSDLLTALAEAGSLTEDAGTEVEISNPSTRMATPPESIAGAPGVVSPAGHSQATLARPQVVRINLATATTNETGSLYVGDGAVIMVEQRDKQSIHVTGLVRQAGRYDFPPSGEFRVVDAIALAGGLTSPVADKLFVIRRPQGVDEPAVVQISFAKAKEDGETNLLLAAGDVVSVEHSPGTMMLETLRMLNLGLGYSLNGLF